MQIVNSVLAFVALYTVYSAVYPFLAFYSCLAGVAIFLASTIIDRIFEDSILAVGVLLVLCEILAAQWSPGGIIFALQARNQVYHCIACEDESDTVSELSFESASDVTLVATVKPVPTIDEAVLKSIGLSAISVNNLIASSLDGILATHPPNSASQIRVTAALLNPALSHLRVSRPLVKPRAKPASSRVNTWLSSQIKTPCAGLPAISARSASDLEDFDVNVLHAVFAEWENDDTRGLHTSIHAPSNAVYFDTTPPPHSPPPSPSTSAVAVSGHRSAGAAIPAATRPIATRLKATPTPPVPVHSVASDSSAIEARPIAIKEDALLPATALLEAPDLTLETEWTPTVLVWQVPQRLTGDYDGVSASRWSDARMHMCVDDLDTLMFDAAESADVSMDDIESVDITMDDAESADVTMDDADDFDLDLLMYDVKDLDTIMDDINDLDLDTIMYEANDMDAVMYEANDIDAIMADDDASPT